MARREREGRNVLAVGAEMEAKEGDMSCFSRTVNLGKITSVEGEVKEMEEDHCILMVGLHLVQRELERVRRAEREGCSG